MAADNMGSIKKWAWNALVIISWLIVQLCNNCDHKVIWYNAEFFKYYGATWLQNDPFCSLLYTL